MDVLTLIVTVLVLLAIGHFTWSNPGHTCPMTGWWLDTGSGKTYWHDKGETMAPVTFNEADWPRYGSAWVFSGWSRDRSLS